MLGEPDCSPRQEDPRGAGERIPAGSSATLCGDQHHPSVRSGRRIPPAAACGPTIEHHRRVRRPPTRGGAARRQARTPREDRRRLPRREARAERCSTPVHDSGPMGRMDLGSLRGPHRSAQRRRFDRAGTPAGQPFPRTVHGRDRRVRQLRALPDATRPVVHQVRVDLVPEQTRRAGLRSPRRRLPQRRQSSRRRAERPSHLD